MVGIVPRRGAPEVHGADIRDIVAGQRDPAALAKHRNARVKASATDVQRALTGNWREEHLFVLKQALGMYDDIARHLRECDEKFRELLAERSAASVDIGKTPRTGSKARAASGKRVGVLGTHDFSLGRLARSSYCRFTYECRGEATGIGVAGAPGPSLPVASPSSAATEEGQATGR